MLINWIYNSNNNNKNIFLTLLKILNNEIYKQILSLKLGFIEFFKGMNQVSIKKMYSL